jgi:DNA-binding protein HU-beta
MNKEELVKAMAAEAKLSQAKTKAALDAMLKSVKKALSKGDDVVLIGFGSFKVKKLAARKGKNPRTGADLTIPAKKVVRFKAGSALAEKIK